MSYTLLNKIPKQIATPISKKNIVAEKVIKQAKVLAPGEYQDVTGYGYVPAYSTKSISAANFNRSAFIQDDANINAATGTGLQANNRIELPADFINIYNIEIPDSDVDTNVDFFLQNYEITDLAANKMEEGIKTAFSNLEKSLELLNANRIYFGHNFTVTKYGASSPTLQHYNGLTDIFAAAAKDTPVLLDQVGNIDTWAYNATTNIGNRNFDLTQTSDESVVTPAKVFSALATIDFKLSQPNAVFAFGNSATTAWLSDGNEPESIKWVIWASLYNDIRLYNIQLYKQLEDFYDMKKLIVLQEGSLDVEKINRTPTELGLARSLTISPANLNLPRNCIGMYSSEDFYKGKYSAGDKEEQILTTNNLTDTLKKLQACTFSTYLPNGPVAIVKIPAILDDNQILPDKA